MSQWPYCTARWRRLRIYVIASEPLCRYCKEQGRVTVAVDIDHIIPLAKRPDLAFDQNNLQPLCRPCHSGAKQAEERAGHRIGCDVNGVPLKGW